PPVAEFTPDGWHKFRDEVAEKLQQLPAHSSYREKDPAPELWVRQAQEKGKLIEAYQAVDPGERPVLFRKVADHLIGRMRGGNKDDTFDRLVEAYEKEFPG